MGNASNAASRSTNQQLIEHLASKQCAKLIVLKKHGNHQSYNKASCNASVRSVNPSLRLRLRQRLDIVLEWLQTDSAETTCAKVAINGLLAI